MSSRSFTLQPWNTPFNHEDDLGFVVVYDGEFCRVLVEFGEEDQRRRYCVTVEAWAVHCIDESFRLELWERRDAQGLRRTLGYTFEVLESPWIEELRTHEPLVDEYCPGLRHFVMASDVTVVELFTVHEPRVDALDPGARFIDLS